MKRRQQARIQAGWQTKARPSLRILLRGDPDDLSHVDLDSCFLKCVDKLKGCQDIYLQKHYCTHPSNMTHPYIMTLACAVMVLSTYLVFAYTIWLFMAIVNMQCYRTVF